MIYVVFKKETGKISRTLNMPEFMLSEVNLSVDEDIIEVDKPPNDTTQKVSNGEVIFNE